MVIFSHLWSEAVQKGEGRTCDLRGQRGGIVSCGKAESWWQKCWKSPWAAWNSGGTMAGHSAVGCAMLRIGTADAKAEGCPFPRAGGVAEDRHGGERMLIAEAVSNRRSGYAPGSFLPLTYPLGTFPQPAVAPPPARVAFHSSNLPRFSNPHTKMLILTAGANFHPRREVF